MLVVVVERRTHGVGRHDPHAGLRSFRNMPTPASVPPVPMAQVKASTVPAGLLPDLGAGGAVVARAVGDIVELVGPDGTVGLGAGQLLGQAAGYLHIVVGVAVGHGRDRAQLGADQTEHVHLLGTLRLGDDDDGAVAAGVADQGKADAGIAGRALDDHPAGAKLAPLLGIGDDGQRRPVLDAAAGIEELALAQDLAAGHLRHALEAHQRRVADEGREIVPDCRGGHGQSLEFRRPGVRARGGGDKRGGCGRAGGSVALPGERRPRRARGADRHPRCPYPPRPGTRVEDEARGAVQLHGPLDARQARGGHPGRAGAEPAHGSAALRGRHASHPC